MKLLSLFSGIGAFETALKRCGIAYDLAGFCEIDKFASAAYSLIHDEPASKNLGDICAADCSKLKDVDLVCYGFPCQDISVAGKQRGFSHDGQRTRSGLFFEALRIIRECRPKIAIAENVKALTSTKFAREFDIVLSELAAAGYQNYWKILNARDFGLPQNRERVFIVSIRADIDAGFEFPAPIPLSLRLADVLERDVPDNFFIKETERTREIVEKYAKSVIRNDANLRQIVAMRGRPADDGRNVQNLELRPDDCSNALTTVQKDNLVIESTPRAGIKCLGNIYTPTINRQSGRVYDPDGLCATITTSTGGNRQPITLDKSSITPDFRIRKLTPRECWRLQGFTDAEFDRAKNGGISNSQLYKMAGNSIAVNVLAAIFQNLRKYFEN